LKVFLIQFSPTWENKESNYSKVQNLIERSFPEPHSLVVLPEAFATGFSLNPKATTRAEPDQTYAFLSNISISHKIWILAGVIVPNENNTKAKNIAVLFNPNGKQVGVYQKMYPFTPMGEEKVHTRGKSTKTFHVEGFQLSPILCYDLRFPELFRMNIVQGTNLFVVIASWPKVRINHWHTLLQARAIENQAYVIGLNRTGKDPNHNYAGSSRIIDPTGKTVIEMKDKEEVASTKLDRKLVNQWRNTFPVLQDIRKDLLP
jgi:predicted amidohydrolase